MLRRTGFHAAAAGAAVVCALGAGLVAGARECAADQILEIYGNTLTSYKPLAGTTEQKVWPRFTQRGVNIDGSVRAGPSFAWALGGNPFEGGGGGGRIGDVMLAAGAYSPTEVDLALPSPGRSGWVIGRTHNHLQGSSSHVDSDGLMGFNWFQSSIPELIYRPYGVGDAPGDPTKDLVYIVYGADRFLEFKRTGESSNEFKAKNGAAGVVQYVAGTPDTYVWYDQHGTRTYFFGDNTTSARANWQLWKIVDPSGNAAYVGDASSASSAVTNGYNADGTMWKAYDGANRRYCYGYGTYGGQSRLTQVKVETAAGEEWAACGSDTLVAQVDYEYYASDTTGMGKAGDLKLVTVTMVMSDSTVTQVKKKHYRSYDQAFNNSNGRRGEPHMIKMVVGFEGCRRQDWVDGEWDNDFLSETDDNLKPYAEAYLEYVSASDYRVKKVWFNGQCGCGGGGGAGTYEFTYGQATSYSTYIGNTSYDTTGNPAVAVWATRTVVTQPDGKYFTQYFDETGQPMSRVVTDGDPAVSYTDMWATEVIRNNEGQVKEVRSPAANNTYTHNDGQGKPSGTFTSTGSALVTVMSRWATTDMKGFLEFTTHKTGTGGTEYYDAKVTYGSLTKTIGGSTLARPVVIARRAYHVVNVIANDKDVASNFRATTYTDPPAGWTGDAALMLKQVTTTYPIVTTDNNGSNTATTSKLYLRKDGTTAFSETPDSVFTYTKYSSGQVSTRIEDAQTNHGSAYGSADDPANVWGISETASGLHLVTTYTNDIQGRLALTTMPDGHYAKSYYSVLGDRRGITISFPPFDDITTTWFGPASYTVTNHVSQPEVRATLAIASGGVASSTDWITESATDALDALHSSLKGTNRAQIHALSEQVHDSSGSRLSESRAYHAIAASGSWGSSGSHYDATFFGYDSMGRRHRVKHATGTIERTTFDDLGRVSYHEIGTNDPDETGTDNMVKMEELTYDLGADGGNSYVTARTLFVETGTSGQRQTTYQHDLRGRVVVTVSPVAAGPHGLSKFDNLGRLLATGAYSSSTGLDPTDDPTSQSMATNRIGLSQTFFDEKGQVWKSTRHKIDIADGSDDDNVETLNWYDAAGRRIKTDGEALAKTFYDRLGRATNRFILASDNDSAYAHAADVTGDYVLEEHQTYFETTTGNALMTVSISRHHDDTTTTGPLDTDSPPDLSLVNYSGNKIQGRAQIASNWYDELDRPKHTAALGTNGGSNYDRDGQSDPTRSDTVLVTSYAYDTNGTVLDVTDPRALVARTLYDRAGRRTATIANHTGAVPPISTLNRDTDVYTRYTYASGLQTEMWVDYDGDGNKDAGPPADQVTTYTFGTVIGSFPDSKVATGHLLKTVTYPDSTSGTDVVTYAYNAQGEQIWMKDQAANEVTTDYDVGGRRTDTKDTTTSPGAGFDRSVKRISTTYNSRGLVELATQYDAGSGGTALNEVKHTYDSWGNLEKIEQDRNSQISGDDYEVSYTYSKATTGRNTVRRTSMTLPGATALTYTYGTGGSINDSASRVWEVKRSTTVEATYTYNGAGQLIRTDLPEPDVFYSLDGTTARSYDRLDRFDRTVSSIWTRDLATDIDFYDVDIAYDRNSNPTQTEDHILTAGLGGSGNGLFDVNYDIDGLDRVTRAKEGHWDGTTITDPNTKRDELWTGGLSQTGLWSIHKLDNNGYPLNYNEAGELNESNSLTSSDPLYFNAANEWLKRNTNGTGDPEYTLEYDAVGNLIDDGMGASGFEFVYDIFGRLRQLKKSSDSTLLAEYTYNGLGHRLSWHYDTDKDGDVDSSDDTFYFVYDDRWRIVGMYKSNGATLDEEYVYHNAGASGFGGSSYIDTVILRLRGSERRYYCQNWRADVSVIVTEAGGFVERVKYSAYGTPFGLPAGDNDSDGDCDATDAGRYFPQPYDVRFDLDLDGDIQNDDLAATQALSGTTLGRGKLSRTDTASRKGYAGYENDGNLVRFYHVRHRMLDTLLGRWPTRDPIGYVDGVSLQQYVGSRPLTATDATGLAVYCPPENVGLGGIGCNDEPQQPPYLPLDDCNRCVGEFRRNDPLIREMINFLIQRGCYDSCADGLGVRCGSGPLCGDSEGYQTRCAIIICYRNIRTCDQAYVTLLHELYHAWDECVNRRPCSGGTCLECLCCEVRAQRFAGGCQDGGVDRAPGETEEECLWRFAKGSCTGRGRACQGVSEKTLRMLFNQAVKTCYPDTVID